MNYPCIIKPSRIQDVKAIIGGRKGWIARDLAEFDRVILAIPPEAGMLLVQEIVPGPESAITLFCGYVDSRGQMHQPFTARKLRQYPPGFGSASMVQSAAEPESRAIAERLLAAVGYRGIAAAEFKRDPASGALKIIEINARPSLWFSLSTAAGKQVIMAAYSALAGLGTMPAEIPQSDGIRWRYTLKDIRSALFYCANPSFVLPPPDTAVLGPAGKRVSPVFAWDDPGPALVELVNFGRKSVSRMGRMIFGR